MKNTLKTIIAVAALGTASIASAITYDAAIDGTTFGDGSFSANGDSLAVATLGGVTFLGINGGAGGAEIGLDEMLTVTLNNPGVFSSITLGLVFDGPEFGDLNEIAAALTDASGTVYTLTIDTVSTATWTGFAGATVTNISPAALGSGGVWMIENPFGNAVVGQLDLYPLASGGQNESDFGLVSFHVPDNGATLALLGLGLSGLAFFRRKI